jgi:glycine cleavage system transcriptional repressor
MKKIIISVLGQDRPGIIAAVSRLLFEENSNIENVSQTSLQTEFAGIFIAAIPRTMSHDQLEKKMREALSPMQLQVHVKPMASGSEAALAGPCEPFIISTRGPDQKGLVARITEVIARHNTNITKCHAVFKGGDNPNENFMIYEVDIPLKTDNQRFFHELRACSAALNLQVSIQHRDIFEALNRI